MIIYPHHTMNGHFMKIIPRSEIETRLSDAGLEMTPQRFAVLECLVRSDDNPTVEQILIKLQRLYPRPSRESIEKTLLTLCGAGLVGAVIANDKSIRYSLRFDPRTSPLSSEFEDD